MHLANCLAEDIPVFIPHKVVDAPPNPPRLFRVRIRVLMAPSIEHLWIGWSSGDLQARDRAVEDARKRWLGYPWCVMHVEQVGA